MSTILVAGATGNVGHHVVRELRERDVKVRALSRDPQRAADLLDPDAGLEIVGGDFGDPASLRAALDGVERVFLACPNDPRQVEWETNLIDAAAGAGVARLVKISTHAARIGSPVSFWDWQGRIEEHLWRSGVPSVLLHSGTFMSLVLASAGTVATAGTIFAPAGGARLAMIDPRDVAAVAAAVLTGPGHDGRTYVLTGPQALTFEAIAEALAGVIGRPVSFVDIPDDAARASMLGAGLPPWLVDNLIPMFGAFREGAMAQVTDLVRVLTGRDPRTVEDFMDAHRAAFGA